MRNMWSIPVTPKSGKWAGNHPTQKPFELLKRVILSSTVVGDIVLDPFLGSGTTSVVAEFYSRNSIGIEINNDYVNLIKTRLNSTRKGIEDKTTEIEFVEM